MYNALKKKVLPILILLFISITAFSACSKVDFKVSFIVDGDIVATVSTNGSETIKMPNDPEKEGYTFGGWYWDKDTWERDFTANSLLNEPLSSNMSVYAKWNSSISSFVITFESNGGTFVEVQNVEKNAKIIPPNTPYKENFIFTGWYLNNDNFIDDFKWIFSEHIVTNSMTLYAGWEETSEPIEENVILSDFLLQYDQSTNSYSITSYTGSELDVVFVSYYKDIPVESVFLNDREYNFNSITIPDSLKDIHTVYINGEVLNYYASNTNPHFKIENNIVYNPQKTALFKVMSFNSIKQLIIPKGVTRIENYALISANYEYIKIPDTVSFIGTGNIESCRRALYIKSINLPFIDNDDFVSPIFSSYSTLKVYVPDDLLQNYKDSWRNFKEFYPIQEEDFSYESINNGIRIIQYLGLEDEVTIPHKIQGLDVVELGIDSFAFSTISFVELPPSVVKIHERAFRNCNNLRNINLNEGLKRIDTNVFCMTTNLGIINIPVTVEYIAQEAFGYDNNFIVMNSIEAPIFNNNYGGWGGCIIVPDEGYDNYLAWLAVKVVKKSDIINNLLTEQDGDGLRIIGYLEDNNNVVFPTELNGKSITEIGYSDRGISYNRMFAYRDQIESITFSEGIQAVGINVAEGLPNLKTVNISASIKIISDSAFWMCYNLENVNIPVNSTLKTIGNEAFRGCSKLNNIFIPETVDSIGGMAFERTKWIDNQTEDFVIVNNMLLLYKGEDSVVNIPQEVNIICSWAFYGNQYIEVVNWNDGLKSIGERAFSECNNIINIIIPSQILHIGSYAFASCADLKEITFLSEIPPKIESRIFYDTTSYLQVYVPIDSLAKYQNAENWSEYYSVIYPK